MAIDVKKLVVHYVDKKDDDTQIHLRNDEMTINDKVAVFIEQLHHAYNGKPGKGFCAFSGEKNSIVASTMQSYRNNELGFWHMTEQASTVLNKESFRHHVLILLIILSILGLFRGILI